ncbi:MAG: hypothetical protein KatS3mg110_4360 [Pirellulaceae bacterium]|nr:MAG: hypothetical protein KatS3mg110_4360 [Pirellulaceae bacterium]
MSIIRFVRMIALSVAGFLVLSGWVPVYAQHEAAGLRAPVGFTVTLFADDDLAHDIFSMTTDSRGDVWVAGAGYVRVLRDNDRDGRADEACQFADLPRNGAQGLWCETTQIFCVGDGGLLRFWDKNGDRRADGPPELLVPIRTGGEHHAHAVRRGPDGFLYLIAGNDSQVDAGYAGPHSPVNRPKAGCLLRIDPENFSTTIVCDGFRNAYDFDFDSSGRIYVYDSDDERDVSFPWYRPTRVIQVLAGGTAGWFTRTWKPPDASLDIMPVVARLGRGSPTGVVWYDHGMFPPPYRGTLFVADWTFGRVLIIRPRYDSSQGVWSSTVELFLQSDGSMGFAPTDLAVGADGALFVSVGGRGTRGGVYRVTWQGHNSTQDRWVASGDNLSSAHRPHADTTELPPQNVAPASQASPPTSLALTPAGWRSLLGMPDPWSPAGRELWQDAIRLVGARALQEAALDEKLPWAWRVRAIQYHGELFGPLPAEVHLALSEAPGQVRQSAARLWGRFADGRIARHELVTCQYLIDRDPHVVRALLDSLCGNPYFDLIAEDEDLFESLLAALATPAHDVRRQAVYCLSRSGRALREVLAARAETLPLEALVAVAAAAGKAGDVPKPWLHELCHRVERSTPPRILLDAVRAAQLLAGDARTFGGTESVFDGFSPDQPDRLDPEDLRMLHEWLLMVYPTPHAEVNRELERLAAVVAMPDDRFRRAILEQFQPSSPPSDDIHRLVVWARLPGRWEEQELYQIASLWAAIEHKMAAFRLHEDRHWPIRWQELLRACVERDGRFAQALVEADAFGHAGHVCLLPALPAEQLATALDRLWPRFGYEDPEPWPAELIQAAVRTGREDDRRRLVERLGTGWDVAPIVEALAEEPRAEERRWYRHALYEHSIGTLQAAVAAYETLPPANDVEDTAALVAALRKLDGEPASWQLRQQVSRLLERVVPENFGFVYGPEGRGPQPWVLQGWRHWLEAYAPHLVERVFGRSVDTTELEQRLARIDWNAADPLRGQRIFMSKGCGQCHSSRYALGPDLSGITRRFSRADLFRAIVFPSADVSPRYQTRVIETTDGRIVQGAVVYESVDGVTIVTPDQRTVRLEKADIARQENSPISLMPAGLLDGLSDQDWADLYAWLATL